MRKTPFLAAGLGLLGVFSGQAPVATAAPGDHKVVICHIPPGNPANAHTIVVDEHAWPAHEAHGDLPWACGSGGGGTPE